MDKPEKGTDEEGVKVNTEKKEGVPLASVMGTSLPLHSELCKCNERPSLIGIGNKSMQPVCRDI